MKIEIEGSAKEIAALVLLIQERQEESRATELSPGALIVLNG